MSDSDNSATRQVAALGARAWRWARGCVSALVSDLASRESSGRGWTAMLLVQAGPGRLLARRKGVIELVAQGTIEQLAEAAKSALTRSEQQALTLRFGGDRAIVHELLLPESARPLLSAILRNKIESLAPWPIEDTAWGFQAGEAGRGGNMAVAVGAIGRRALQIPIDTMAARGLKPVAVEIDTGESQAPIVLDHNSEVRRRRLSLVLRGALGGLTALLLAAGAFGGVLAYHDMSDLAAIEARTETLKQQLTGKGGASSSGIVAAASAIVDARKQQRPLVAVLNELTHVIPNGSWLTAIDLLEGKITIQGRGGVASDLVQALEASDVFSEVNFAAATQRDEQSGAEIYSIAATVTPNTVAE